MPEVEQYNYAVFEGTESFLLFRTGLHVGDPAPDGELIELGSGRTVQLSDSWRERDVLIEFGSLTLTVLLAGVASA
jgi:hypothetical protein